ncbi:MAG: gliding motility-associated C-terminal domain-containing protein, partial [Bacteroidota bacterium]
VELDKRNNVHLLGQTHASGSFYIQNANYGTPNSGQYISKLTPQLNAITWSTAFGTGTGAPNISPTAFLVDVCNSIYLSGWGGNTNQLSQIPGRNIAGYTIGMDITPDAFQSTTDSSDFYLMVIDGDANGLIFGSFFGGHVSSEHVDGGTSRFDRQGRIYQSVCAGCRECQTCPSRSDFPIFPANAVSDTNLSTNCNNAVFKLDFDLPLIIADFNGPEIGCVPFTANFTNSSIVLGTTTILWNFGDGNTSTDLQPSHTYTDTGTFEVSLIISDINSCNRNDTLIRTIRVRGPQSLDLGVTSLCEARPVGIGIPPLGDPDANYTWTPTTGLSNPNISNPSADGNTDIDYQLLIERDGNCVDTVRQSIIYSPLEPFAVTATSDRDSLSTGQQTTLHVEPDSGFIIQWTPPNLLDDPTSSDPRYLGTIDPEEQEEITFTVTVSDPRDNNCFKTSSVSLLIFEEVCGDPEVFLPNAFTPNGDGSNDVLFVRGDNIEQVSLVIYNRWGQQVFETKDAAIGWDGRFNGTDVDPDVYVFYLEVTCLDGQEFIKEGNITVIR